MRKPKKWILSGAIISAMWMASPTTSPVWAQDGGLSGTYAMKGNKGDIILILTDDGQGGATGSLRGGELSLVLKGFPAEGGGVLGTATTDAGQFASYFAAVKQNGQILFELIQANADGDPDMNQRSRLTFSAAQGGNVLPDGGASQGGDNETLQLPESPAKSSGTGTSAGSSPWQGTFTGDGLILSVGPVRNGSASGTVSLEGQKFPFAGRVNGNSLTGSFSSGGDAFPFTASLNSTILKFSTGGTDYNLNRPKAQPKPNPLAKPKAASKPNPLAKAAVVKPNPLGKGAKPGGAKPADVETAAEPVRLRTAGWKIYKHATGLSVRYPGTWTPKKTEDALQLVPPDAASNQYGPREIYLVMGEGAEGITTATDPRVGTYLDQQLAQMIPFLRRTAEPEQLKVGAASAVLLTWEGANPRGTMLRAQAYTAILNGFAIAVVALGEKPLIAKREAVLREILSSLSAGAGERDPRIAGTWTFWSYKSSAGGKYGVETKRRFVLQPDGTCLWSSSAESSGSFSGTNTLGEQTWTGGVAGNSTNKDQGKWTAGNGELYVLWNDGSTSQWDYNVTGTTGSRKLFLKGSKPQPDEWMEAR